MFVHGFKIADRECVHLSRKCDMETGVSNLDLSGTAKSFKCSKSLLVEGPIVINVTQGTHYEDAYKGVLYNDLPKRGFHIRKIQAEYRFYSIKRPRCL